MAESHSPVEKKSVVVKWAELVGIVGLIVSLVFVGIQIQQSTAIAKAEAYQSFVSSFNDIILKTADPQVASAYSRHFIENIPFEELGPAERSIFLTIQTAIIRSYEGLYRQVEAGVLDESAYELVDFYMEDAPHVRASWSIAKVALSSDFKRFLEHKHPYLRSF